MGWFGWGICKEYFYGLFFVPAWGWGGSVTFSFQNTVPEIFVPAWGWVGSSLMVANIPEGRKFSSPLGDGLVLLDGKATTLKVIIFVPAWGWVGSRRKNY